MVDEKTRDTIAAILTLPVANRIVQGMQDLRYPEQEMQQIVATFLRMKQMVKKSYE